MGARLGRLRRDPFLPIWPATLVLLLLSPLLAPGSVSGGAIVGMLPFVAILAIASIGQTLVVQQRGLDLSIPGVISLTTILITKIPKGDDAQLPLAPSRRSSGRVSWRGLISGLAVTRFGITPLIATLGVNALLIGTVLQLTTGQSSDTAAPALDAFAFGRTLGIPNTLYRRPRRGAGRRVRDPEHAPGPPVRGRRRQPGRRVCRGHRRPALPAGHVCRGGPVRGARRASCSRAISRSRA